MEKFGRIAWKLLLMLVSLPLIKGFYDTFTAPTTGLLVVAGADANTLAIITAIPWVFPIGCVVAAVIDLTKGDEPKNNFPQQ